MVRSGGGRIYNLALMIERGRGVRRDPERAVKLYEKAAAIGIIPARLNLSLLFARGTGVERDPLLAYMWLEMAIAGGVQGYDAYRRNLANMPAAEQIVEAKRMAREGLERIEQGQKE